LFTRPFTLVAFITFSIHADEDRIKFPSLMHCGFSENHEPNGFSRPTRCGAFRPDSHVNCSAAAHALTLIPAAARSTYELPYKNEIRPISRGRDPATVGIFGLWELAAAINRYKSGPSTVTRLIARRFVIPQKHSCPPQQLIKS
jgi:hypothetical protein